MIVLDTHVLIWLRGGSERLGPQARQLAAEAWGARGRRGVRNLFLEGRNAAGGRGV